MKPITLIVPAVVLSIAISGCTSTGGTQTQKDAAAKLAADCQRTVKDAADQHVVASGNKVTLKLSEDDVKHLRAFGAQEVTAENLTNLTKQGGSFMDSFGVAIGVLADTKCLVDKTGVPTDAKGSPKAGEWPNWTVTMDADGLPTFESTTKG